MRSRSQSPICDGVERERQTTLAHAERVLDAAPLADLAAQEREDADQERDAEERAAPTTRRERAADALVRRGLAERQAGAARRAGCGPHGRRSRPCAAGLRRADRASSAAPRLPSRWRRIMSSVYASLARIAASKARDVVAAAPGCRRPGRADGRDAAITAGRLSSRRRDELVLAGHEKAADDDLVVLHARRPRRRPCRARRACGRPTTATAISSRVLRYARPPAPSSSPSATIAPQSDRHPMATAGEAMHATCRAARTASPRPDLRAPATARVTILTPLAPASQRRDSARLGSRASRVTLLEACR